MDLASISVEYDYYDTLQQNTCQSTTHASQLATHRSPYAPHGLINLPTHTWSSVPLAAPWLVEEFPDCFIALSIWPDSRHAGIVSTTPAVVAAPMLTCHTLELGWEKSHAIIALNLHTL